MKEVHGDKVVFVCTQMSRGGAERVVSILANYFYKKGYRVSVITLENAPLDYVMEKGIKIFCAGIEREGGKAQILKGIIKARKIISENDYVIALATRPVFFTVMSSVFLKTRRILTERNNPYMSPETWLKRKLRNISLYFGDRIVFQTSEQKEYFKKSIQNKGVVISNPIRNGLPINKLNKENKIIVSACRLKTQKNIKMSIDAFGIFWEKHKDFQFHIYGKGSLRDELVDYIDQKGLKGAVQIRDFSNHIEEVFSNAMIFLSSSDYEGISNSMLEAMAIGLPVICTDCPVGGARETIRNGYNGFLVSIGDTEAMAEYMNKLAEDDMLREYISRNGMKLRDDLNIDKICEKWENILD